MTDKPIKILQSVASIEITDELRFHYATDNWIEIKDKSNKVIALVSVFGTVIEIKP